MLGRTNIGFVTTDTPTGGGYTYLWNESPKIPSDSIVSIDAQINFISNNTSYNQIKISQNTRKIIKYGEDTIVYSQIFGWADEAYRTITFESEPTGDLLDYLNTNATKQ